jgi:hypothetical protein
MHCPNCGKPSDTEQQFCRACGMSLETVGKLVVQHSSSPLKKQKKIDKAELEQAMVQKMFNWLMWGMIVIGVGVAMLIVNKYFDLGRWFSLVSASLLLGGTAIASAGVLNAVRQGVRVSGMQPSVQISGSLEPKSLPTNPIPASLPSITERTTRLIPSDDARANDAIDSNGRE